MSSVYNRGSTLWFANDPSAGLMLFYWSCNAEELSSALKKGQWRRRTPNTPQGTFKCGIIPLIRHVMLTSVLESQKAWNGEIEGNPENIKMPQESEAGCEEVCRLDLLLQRSWRICCQSNLKIRNINWRTDSFYKLCVNQYQGSQNRFGSF